MIRGNQNWIQIHKKIIYKLVTKTIWAIIVSPSSLKLGILNLFTTNEKKYTNEETTTTIKRFGPSGSSNTQNITLVETIAVTAKTNADVFLDLRFILNSSKYFITVLESDKPSKNTIISHRLTQTPCFEKLKSVADSSIIVLILFFITNDELEWLS